MTNLSDLIARPGLGVPGRSVTLRGAWADATVYKQNDVVENGGSSYACILTHTSGSTTAPGTGASWNTYWMLIAAAGASGGLNGGLYYNDRAAAEAANTSTAAFIGIGPLLYVADADGTALTTGDARTWSPAPGGPITPLHFGAAGDGATGDSAAFESMLDWLADTTGIAAVQGSSRRVVDLAGQTYLLTVPLFIGKFDFNLDGTDELGCGPIAGVTFANGKLKASNGGTFPERIAGEIGSHLAYVGVTQSTSYSYSDGSGNMFEVANIHFENVEFDCNFTTGGVWIENTHRVHVSNCTIENVGIGCDGIATCIQSGSHPRGVACKNQETVIRGNRFEGNLRVDGLTDYPDGRDAFGEGGEVFASQAVPSGAFTMNGSDVVGGEWVAPGDPMFVEFKNSYVSADATYADLSGSSFTISGFADAAKTTPLTEVVKGPIGGSKARWTYSANRYAVITGITSSAAVTGTNDDVICSASYKSAGIRMQSHDFYIMENVITAFERAMIIRGRAGQVYGNHPWSREILFEENASLVNVFGNYFDFTDVTVRGSFKHQFNGNSWPLGNCGLLLVATGANTTADGLTAVGNQFNGNGRIEFIEDTGTWSTDSGGVVIEATLVGNSFEVEGDYTNLDGYLTVRAGARILGNLTMGANNITDVANPTAPQHAATKAYVDTAVAGGGAGDLLDGTEKTGDLWLSGFGRFDGALNVGGYATHGAGGSFGGNVTMGNYRITNLAAPSSANDAARKAYVDFHAADQAAQAVAELVDGTPYTGAGIDLSGFGAFGGSLNVGGYATHEIGGSFGGNLDMKNNRIVQVATPTAATNAANKSYVDTAITAASDYRLKFDVVWDDKGGDRLSEVSLYRFRYKDNPDQEQYGVLAHELQQVFPAAVTGEPNGPEMQRVNYAVLVPHLIAAIQKLERRVSYLEAKCDPTY